MSPTGNLVPRLSSRAWVVLGGDALSAIGSGLTLPFFLVYLHRVRGIGLGQAGLILATIAAAGLLGNPAGGWLADRIGPRRSVVAGLVVTAAGTLGFAVVHTAATGFATAAVYGLGMSVLWPAEDAMLATAVDAGQRPQVFAVRHATLNAGFGMGGLLAALVVSFASPASFTLLYLVDAASFLAFAGIVAMMTDTAPVATEEAADAGPAGYRKVFADRLFRRLWVIALLMVTAGYAQYHAAFPAFATGTGHLSAQGLALTFAANTVTVVGAQLVVLRLMAGRRRTRGVVVSAAFVAAAWLATMLGGSHALTRIGPVLFVVAMVLFALGETLLSPTLPAILNDIAPESLRGRYNGGYTLAWSVGYIAGPALAGFALASGRGQLLFAALIGALCLAALAARRLETQLPPATNRIPAAAPVPGTGEPLRVLAKAVQDGA